MMNKDRLSFVKKELNNGHTLYYQVSDLPVVYVRIVIPVGNSHSHTGNINAFAGCFHFLEHMCFTHSEDYPNKFEYQRLLTETGCSQNAWTGSSYTEFTFEAPTETFHNAFLAFLNHIIAPRFEQAEIELQKTIIKNERTQRKYYPGDDELSHYCLTEWMSASYYSKEQLFGSDTSLNNIDPTVLKAVHGYYFNQPITIFAAGSFNINSLSDQLSRLPITTKKYELEEKCATIAWKHKEFHTFQCTDIDTSIYHFGSISTKFSIETAWMVDFILELLAHEEFGVLQTWIRNDNGWSYGLERDLSFDKDRIMWSIKVPVDDVSLVTNIRNEIASKIKDSVSNSNLVSQTKQRLLLRMNFDLETLTSRLDAAIFFHGLSGEILKESAYRNWLENYVTKETIENAYKELFSHEVIGEFLAVPKPEQSV